MLSQESILSGGKGMMGNVGVTELYSDKASN